MVVPLHMYSGDPRMGIADVKKHLHLVNHTYTYVSACGAWPTLSSPTQS